MVQPIAFDTHAYVKKLKATGVPEEQAEVHAGTLAEFIDDQLATKRDIILLQRDTKGMETGLKRDIKELETELKRDIKEMETKLQHDINKMETELKRDINEMETRLQHDTKEMELRLRHDLTVRLGGISTTGIVIVAALVKLL